MTLLSVLAILFLLPLIIEFFKDDDDYDNSH